jgi:phosphopantetheinyl transferase (holo-ACP synthase)
MIPDLVNPESGLRVRVGNDVVDLEEPRARGKSDSPAFLRRVFSPYEAEWIAEGRDSEDRDRRLWTLWAGKETAFKVLTKVLGAPPVFIHREFVCHPAAGGTGWGHVHWQGRSIGLTLQDSGDRLHMLGWASPSPPHAELLARARIQLVDRAHPTGTGPDDDWQGFLDLHFSPREADPIHSVPSALVRLAARRDAAEALGADESRIELICGEGPKGRTPPRLLLDGDPIQLDVSLSHHGRYIGWVLSPTHPDPGD